MTLMTATSRTTWRSSRNYLAFEIARDEDWNDPLPVLKYSGTGDIIDLTGKTLSLYVRPTYDHSVILALLTQGAGVVIDNAAMGLASIIVPRADVITAFPVGRWDQFMVMQQSGLHFTELWRGPLIVKPGKISL